MAIDAEFRDRMYQAKIPSYSRGANPYHARYRGFREAVGALDPSKLVWMVVDDLLEWPQREPMYKLWGVAAKGSLMQGEDVLVYDAKAIGGRAEQDWFSFLDEFGEYMLFLYNFFDFKPEELAGMAKVISHWQSSNIPIWIRTWEPPANFLQTIPRSTSHSFDVFRKAVRRAQLLEAQDYV